MCCLSLPRFSENNKFLYCLTFKVVHILSLYLFVEISIFGDFNHYHQLLIFPPFPDHPDEQTYKLLSFKTYSNLCNPLLVFRTVLELPPSYILKKNPTHVLSPTATLSKSTQGKQTLVLYFPCTAQDALSKCLT